MSRIIECQVNDEYILGSGVPIGAAGSFGDVKLRLSFNEMWDGLSIVATFKDALGQNEHVVMLFPSMLEDGETRTYLVPVPKAAKALAGRAKLTLSGYSTYTIDADGTKTVKKDSLTNTATAFFRVLESDSAIVDDDSVDATPEEQVQAELVAFGERMTGLEGEMGDFKDEVEGTLDGYEKQEKTRDDAEEQRQINEFGAVGNHWNDDETAIVDADGNVVELEMAGRVGAELLRRDAEVKRNAVIGDIEKALDDIILIQNMLIERGVTVNVPIPVAAETDDGKILSVEDGEYVLKDIGDSSVKSYVDEYIESALGGDY